LKFHINRKLTKENENKTIFARSVNKFIKKWVGDYLRNI